MTYPAAAAVARRRARRGAPELTAGRARLLAVAAVAAAALWSLAFVRLLRPLWGDLGGLYAAVHLTGVAALTVAGGITWRRRPGSRIGPLLVAGAFACHIAALQWYPLEHQFVSDWTAVDVANWLGGLPTLIFVQTALTFPSGRAPGRFERVLIAAMYAVVLGAGWLLPTPLFRLVTWPGLALMLIALFAVVVRYVRASPAGRRVIGPVPLVVMLISLAAFTYAALQGLEDHSEPALRAAQFGLVAANPAIGIAFTVSLLRMRLAWAGVGDLVVGLQRRPGPGGLRAALREALRDPRLDVGYWLPDSGRYIDSEGREIDEAALGSDRVVTAIRDGHGNPLAVIIHDAALADEPDLVHGVGAAVQFALENARLQAALELQLKEVQASRVRLVTAADTERRRVERNLHDGAQQQLVAVSLLLEEARSSTTDPAVSDTLATAAQELRAGLQQLRELARGIHPAILTEQGLAAALRALGRRMPCDVQVDAVDGRFAEHAESTIYFVAAEALTNIVKHAGATRAWVRLECDDGTLRLEVTDDGQGGARPTDGGGLQGLVDRVAALQGVLRIADGAAGGTVVHASVPTTVDTTTH